MSSFGVGLGSWKPGRVADSSALTRMIKLNSQGQSDATYADTQKKNPFRLSSAILNTYSYNSGALGMSRINNTVSSKSGPIPGPPPGPPVPP